jgi:HAD superfamily hydrolase (TIGR01509 family)
MALDFPPNGNARTGTLFGDVRGVLVDLFDTLISVDASRLPTLVIDGQAHASTFPALCQTICRLAPELESDRVLTELFRTLTLKPIERDSDNRERPSRLLFENLLQRLGVSDIQLLERWSEQLCDLQMECIAGAVRPLPHALELLREFRKRGLRTALVSNLDHARAAPLLLDKAGLASLFDVLVLSEDVGVVKPHEAMFLSALEQLGINTAQALHIGDDLAADIWGAGRLGIRTVWLNPQGLTYPRDAHPPTLVISNLRELFAYL